MNSDSLDAQELWNNPGLRIALVTETYPPEINGVAMTLRCMVEGLIARGHRVQLIRPRQTPADVPHEQPALDEVLAKGWKLPRYDGLHFGLPARTRLLKLWLRQRPDLVHVATEGPLGWSAVSAARKLRIPVTSDFHTNFDHYSRHYGVGWLRKPVSAYLRSFHNRTARTFVPTTAMAVGLTEQGYHRVDVVARGVNTALYDPVRRDPALREAWGANADAPVVLYVGRLAAEKNLPLALQAFRGIQLQTPEARFVLVGDGPMRAALTRDNPDCVFAGMRRGEDLARYYASADVFLFPSVTETFGNVTLEAMASGLCVVAYDYAAAADVIRDGENGVLVAFDDAQGFLLAAQDATGDAGRRAAMGLRARQTAMTLDWDAINDRFAAALLEVWKEAQ
jgi:glycosyltransferase involved in cell wall biosynthesis